MKRDEASDQLQKYEAVEKILKAESISNGLTKRKNKNTTVQIAGGLFNYVLAMMNTNESFSVE